MESILITQCLQNDFVRLLDKYDPLPNFLHIGYSEANRLLGERADEGPVAQIIRWAYAQHENDLKIIHIRDWHDETNPEEKHHLAQFGKHCLKNSEGAKFVFESQIKKGRDHSIVDASGLNDFHETNLKELLEKYTEAPIKVGLIGVWTEAKITFLAYELLTRYPTIELALCSALTASSSRSAHFIALDHLKRILGIKVFDSVATFAEHLGGSSHASGDPKREQRNFLESSTFTFNIPYTLQDADNQILHYLYRDSKSTAFVCLDGGFSGNVVLKAQTRDGYGQATAPTVVKIGARDPIARERAAFERVQEVLGNSAPAIVDFAEFAERGGIKYRYAAMTDGKVKTFQKIFSETDDVETLKKVLETVFTRQLGKFYDAAIQENLNLLEYYDFQSKYADSVRQKTSELAEVLPDGSLKIHDGIVVENVSLFYERDLQHLKEQTATLRYVSWLHGDLNGANIIIDEAQNVWLIDFFHTHRGHALKDLIKLENDILFIFTKIENSSDLLLATSATDWLFDIHDLAAPLKSIPNELAQDIHFKKSLEVIRYLRSLYGRIIELDRDPYQFFVAALRYAMHTLSFDECNVWQRKWALYAGAKALARVRETLTQGVRLRINFMDTSGHSDEKGLIGMTILPGRQDRGRDLDQDIAELKKAEVRAVVVLITSREFEDYGVLSLIEKYQDASIEVLHSPIKDQGIPTEKQVSEILEFIHAHTMQNERVVLHCVGGLGRTGVIAALYLRAFAHLSADEAMRRVRTVRSPRAIENSIQESFVRDGGQ